jgi:hypothetical protein
LVDTLGVYHSYASVIEGKFLHARQPLTYMQSGIVAHSNASTQLQLRFQLWDGPALTKRRII